VVVGRGNFDFKCALFPAAPQPACDAGSGSN
jgi:hypothetical protein